MKIKLLGLLAVSSMVAGCTFYNVNGEVIHYTARPDRTEHEVQYLETVNVPYDVVGHVSVYTERRNSLEDVADKMKRQAAMLGGDAIINITVNEPAGTFTSIRTTFTGTVIVFKEAPPTAPETADPAAGAGETGENLK